MKAGEDAILEALRTVAFPGYSKNVVELGAVRDLRVDAGRVSFALELGTAEQPATRQRVEQLAREALAGVPGVSSVEIRGGQEASASPGLRVVGTRPPSAAASGALGADLVPGVRRIVAVASGKGGVGKSTVAVNLAVALARTGWTVGLLDADIYGPSIPIMMGLRHEEPRLAEGGRRLIPFDKDGIRFMSLGFLVDPDSAVIWRGPMVMKAIEQLLRDVDWGELDILVVDMPPGTGDAQLTLSQRVRLAGAVIVTTPQDVAVADAIKGVAMFRKVDVPVLGLIENMSYFQCANCDHRTEVFGHGGGREQARRMDVPFLGELPLDPAIRSSGDAGQPIVAAEPDSHQAAAFLELARRVRAVLDERSAPATAAGGIFERFRRVWDGSAT